MSRKGDWKMNTWMDSDIKCARLFNIVCNLSKEDAIAYSGISKNRLFTWKNLGWITDEYDANHSWYRTTQKGREVFEKETWVHPYVSNSYSHDKVLFDYFASRSKSEQCSWKTESELRQLAFDKGLKLDKLSVCDGAYRKDNGEWVFIEITTTHYTKEHIEKKREFARRMGGQFETQKI